MPAGATHPPPLRDLVWQAPLMPAALAATAGLLADRYLGVPLALGVAGFAAALVGWLILSARKSPFAPVLIWCAVGFLAAARHHAWRHEYPTDDIGAVATAEPALVRVRGVLDEEPVVALRPHGDPLMSFDRADPTQTVLEVRELQANSGWVPASGLARLVVQGPLDGLHAGDEVEVVGWLAAPPPADNPGEWDRAEALRDRRIRAEVFVRKTADGVTRLAEGWTASPTGWFAALRRWGQRALARSLPPQQAAVATALLLGEESALSTADWDRYVRTGVVHVLAISGQHFVVLAAFLWLVLKLAGVPRRRAALVVALLLVGYVLLTGGRPPVLRAGVVVVVACLGVLLRREPLPTNNFALAWLVIIALNPTDPFRVGCQLAFLQVAVLTWGVGRWLDRGPEDDVDRLIDQTRSPAVRLLRSAAAAVGRAYAITAILGLVSLPLVAARQHLVSPSGFLIGPPLIVLTSIGLISGFLQLLAEGLGGVLTPIFAFTTRWSLAGCDGLVDLAERLPYSHVYVADVPAWWLWVYYLALLGLLWGKPAWSRLRWLAPAAAGWVGVGLLAGSVGVPPDELRVAFLAVGHGGCTVIETPDGRVLVYDAGALGGPEVARRIVAPYLWSRGVRRIDELFLSHADLDHFNGVAGLLERFEVGQVSWTPSFADKRQPGVQLTVAAIAARGVPARVVQAGDQLTAGDVRIEVLHPPSRGPDGPENARSLVLRLRHAGHTILLTGDLEGPGLERVLAQPGVPVDVLMVPHHGSRTANTPALATWARPRLVVVCDGPPRGPRRKDADPYPAATVWGTWPHGAVTLHSHTTGLVAETYRTRQRLVVHPGSRR